MLEGRGGQLPTDGRLYDRQMLRAVDVGAKLVATGLGSGYSPVAPGTAGSLVGLLLFLPLALFSLGHRRRRQSSYSARGRLLP